MKIIHTSDWHLGNRMHEIDRNREFSSFLKWLKEEIKRQGAQALIVSGDIYDSANPPVESRRQYITFLASLAETVCKNVVIIGGNHDSGVLLDSEKDILGLLNIHVIGSASDLNPEDMVFELYDESGNAIGICAAVPYMREYELRRYAEQTPENDIGNVSDTKTFSDKAYSNLYSETFKVAEKLRADRDIPIIATGHLYAANLEGRLAGHETEIKADDGTRMLDIVGNLGAVHESSFPDGFDYVALGHIHYSSMAGGNPRIMYSGSPFILGFDEVVYERNVLAVDFSRNTGTRKFAVSTKKIKVPSDTAYRRISGKWDKIQRELQEYKGISGETYIEICFVPEDEINIHAEIDKIAKELPENIQIVSRKAIKSVQQYTMQSRDMREIRNMDQEEIFKMLILSRSNDILSGLTDEEKKNKEQELIDKYLPLFREAAGQVENEA